MGAKDSPNPFWPTLVETNQQREPFIIFGFFPKHTGPSSSKPCHGTATVGRRPKRLFVHYMRCMWPTMDSEATWWCYIIYMWGWILLHWRVASHSCPWFWKTLRLSAWSSCHADGLCVHQCYPGFHWSSTFAPTGKARLFSSQRLASQFVFLGQRQMTQWIDWKHRSFQPLHGGTFWEIKRFSYP